MKTPYPFQEQGISWALDRRGCVLADDCGLGKTISAIEIAKRSRAIRNEPEGSKWQCLVICPPALIQQWCDEIAEQDPDMQCVVAYRLPIDHTQLDGYHVMGIYDLSDAAVREELTGFIFDFVIVDEAHRMKNRKTKTADWIHHIIAVRRLCLTGTPMEKNPSDLWSLLHWVAPDKFKSYWNFVQTNLVVTEGYWEKYEIGGPKDPEAFAEVLAPYLLRRTKQEVAPELPPRIDSYVHVSLTSQQGQVYETIKKEKDILVTIEDTQLLIQNALTLITRLQQISAWPPLLGLKDSVGSGKLGWLREFVADHPDEGIIIFTRFRELAAELADEFKASIIIGGRRESVQGSPILVGTIDAMGEGLNLGWASHAIFLDSHWSTIKMTQAFDRIHRIDASEPKNVYLLWSTKEDRLVLEALERKWSEADLIYQFMKVLK